MKRVFIIAVVVILLCTGCATTSNREKAGDYRLENGAQLTDGPLGYIMTAPDTDALALREVTPYGEKMTVTFTMKTDLPDETRNGFLILRDAENYNTAIFAGIYIGVKEFTIEGPGVAESIVVPVEFDQNKEFKITVIVDFKERYIEMQTAEREIGTTLALHVGKINEVGYKVNSTRTHFSRLTIKGK